MKPEAIKVIRVEGGFALYDKLGAMNPVAVRTKALEVLDWIAGRLAEWEEAEPHMVESEAKR